MVTPRIETLTIPEVAAALKVHVGTIWREIARKNLRAVKVGRLTRVRVTEVDAYLERRER